MEKFQELHASSKKKIQIADHIISTTYPLVNDPRLLMNAIEHIFLALTYSMGALLHYERLFKRVPLFRDRFEDKLTLFQRRIMPRYEMDRDYVLLMRSLKEIIVEHHKSPIEFVKDNQFVICDDDYKLKKIDKNQIRGYINQTKSFIDDVNKILEKDNIQVSGHKTL